MACADCFTGSVHEGQPRGTTTNVYGLNAYVVEPTDGRPTRGIIVITPDAFGWEFVNNRILADHYADKGDYKVYIPDFMKGPAAPIWVINHMTIATRPGNLVTRFWHLIQALTGFVPFIIRNRFSSAFPIAKGFFEQLRKEEGATLPVGVAGFCWGGKLALLMSHGVEVDGRSLVDAVFTGHPSFVKVYGDIEKIKLPVSFACPEKDNQISRAQAEKIRTMVEAMPEAQRGEVKIYDNASHGFCVRADLLFADVAKQADEAEDQCISWFNTKFNLGT